MEGEVVRAQVHRRPRVLGVLGTTLEWYDFTLYVYLAPVLSGLFFATGGTDALLATLGVFAVGYLARPLGAVYFGRLGDRRGRRTALSLSVAMMSVPMLLIGLLPTEASIGIAAPVALVLLRLVQGFSVGGEYGGSLVLLRESAASDRRGFITNLGNMAAGAGFVLSSLTAAILHAALSSAQMDAFGWRIAFLIGAGIGLVALAMRWRMEETPDFAAARAADQLEDSPLGSVLKNERRAFIEVFLLVGYLAALFYLVATYLPTFLTTAIGVDPSTALLASTLAALLFAVLTPLLGIWTDRVGRRPLLIAATLGFIVLSVPLFSVLSAGTLAAILAGQLALMLLVAVLSASTTPMATERFRTSTRYTGVTVAWNLGAALFGGTAPLIAAALVDRTGSDLAPGFYMVALSLLLAPVLLRVRETRETQAG